RSAHRHEDSGSGRHATGSRHASYVGPGRGVAARRRFPGRQCHRPSCDRHRTTHLQRATPDAQQCEWTQWFRRRCRLCHRGRSGKRPEFRSLRRERPDPDQEDVPVRTMIMAFDLFTAERSDLLPQVNAIAQSYFTVDTASSDTAATWYAKNPYCLIIAAKDGIVHGYADFLPLTDEALRAIKERELKEENIGPEHILPPQQIGQCRGIYFAGI